MSKKLPLHGSYFVTDEFEDGDKVFFETGKLVVHAFQFVFKNIYFGI